jgi:hypothetical protein
MDAACSPIRRPHHIDLLEWCLGEPVSVFAKTRTALVDIEAEDTGIAVITFRNGALGIVEATTATPRVTLKAPSPFSAKRVPWSSAGLP